MGRTILVGDVHGWHDELCELLEKVNYAQGVDRLVLVGDLVARGPESGGAVARAIEFAAEAVRGNHDEKVLRWWREAKNSGRNKAFKKVKLGDRHTLAIAQRSEEHFEHLESLPLVVDLPGHDLIVVHAGFAPGVSRDQQDPHLRMNSRSIDAQGEHMRKFDGTP